MHVGPLGFQRYVISNCSVVCSPGCRILFCRSRVFDRKESLLSNEIQNLLFCRSRIFYPKESLLSNGIQNVLFCRSRIFYRKESLLSNKIRNQGFLRHPKKGIVQKTDVGNVAFKSRIRKIISTLLLLTEGHQKMSFEVALHVKIADNGAKKCTDKDSRIVLCGSISMPALFYAFGQDRTVI